MPSSLPRAPHEALSPRGVALDGAYAGTIDTVDVAPLLGRGWQASLRGLTARKRWIWGSIATDQVLLSIAIIDAGYVAKGFVSVLDLVHGGALFDGSWIGPPRVASEVGDHPGAGARARFSMPGVDLAITRGRGDDDFTLLVRHAKIRAEATLATLHAPDPLSVVMPVGRAPEVDVTVKTVLLAAHGELAIGDQRFDLAGGHGGLDYTHGVLPRRTEWRWAFAVGATDDGAPVALNLTDGLATSAVREDVLWIDGALVPVGRPSFAFERARPNAPWSVKTDDGAIELELDPKGAHAEALDLALVKSDFLQVGGLWRGAVRGPDGRRRTITRLAGYAEDQRVLW